jgi:hypothetical protein
MESAIAMAKTQGNGRNAAKGLAADNRQKMLAAASRAIFLDAHLASDNAAVRVRRVHPATTATRLAHAGDPQGLLQLTRTAFGRSPDRRNAGCPTR